MPLWHEIGEESMKSILLSIVIVLGSTMTMASSEWDGSRTIPVHRIPVVNEEGERIVPSYERSLPVSTRTTCGFCHDYGKIESGYHFNAARKGARHGRPGEPWVWVDERSGMQLPLSHRRWEGTWHPDDVGLTSWDLTKLFGSHMTGGGVSEPDDFAWGAEARWDVSGKLEINCFACHNASRQQDMTEWTRQIARENFRWAATASSGLGSVDGMASRMDDFWDVHDGPRAGDSAQIFRPGTRYDLGLFDRKGRGMIDIADAPEDRRCFHCHSVARHGATRTEESRDVHTTAGLDCVSCHDNALNHDINRGLGAGNPHSCEGCHMGGGEYGAPRPRHKGLPPVHFKALTCTACHSGYLAETERVRVRTSRANRLGIFGIAQWAREIPFVAEPVLLPDETGRLAPHRMIWPSFWATKNGDELIPIDPTSVFEAGEGVLDADLKVGEVLLVIENAVNRDGFPVFKGVPVLVKKGYAYQRNFDGGLDVVRRVSGLADGWFLLAEEKVTPLIPGFGIALDVENLDVAVSEAIMAVLEALIPLAVSDEQPALKYRNAALYLDEAGWLSETNVVGGEGFAMLRKNGTLRALADPQTIAFAVDTITSESFISEPEVMAVLTELEKDGGTFAYVSNGRMFTLDAAGALSPSAHPAANPYAWPIGHDVRPAAQSLGAKGCKECHLPEAPFFFGAVTAIGPLATGHSAVQGMSAFSGLDESYHNLFGLSFSGRPLFKWVMAAFGLLFLLVVIRGVLAMLHLGVLSFLGRWSRGVGRLSVMVVSVCSVVLAAGGFGYGTFCGGLSGVALLCHTFVGAMFVVALGVCVMVGMPQPDRSDSSVVILLSQRQKWLGWMSVLCGLVLVSSVMIAMVPILDDHGQHAAIVVHRIAGAVFLISLTLFGLASSGARRRALR